MNLEALMTRQVRKYLYGVAMAAMALLVALDTIPGSQAPLWLAVVAAVLGLAAPATALANLTPAPSDIADSAELEIEGE
jgi:hypothetical protein